MGAPHLDEAPLIFVPTMPTSSRWLAAFANGFNTIGTVYPDGAGRWVACG